MLLKEEQWDVNRAINRLKLDACAVDKPPLRHRERAGTEEKVAQDDDNWHDFQSPFKTESEEEEECMTGDQPEGNPDTISIEKQSATLLQSPHHREQPAGVSAQDAAQHAFNAALKEGAHAALRARAAFEKESSGEKKSSGENKSLGENKSSGEHAALKELFEKHGLGDIYQRATQELGLEVLNVLALLVQKYKY
jgi:hypothetical protein